MFSTAEIEYERQAEIAKYTRLSQRPPELRAPSRTYLRGFQVIVPTLQVWDEDETDKKAAV